MSDDRHDELRESLAAYALAALPEAEGLELERHLEGCEGCRERLRWLGPAVDLLPGSVEQRRPPEHLRERVLASVRAEAASERAERAPETRRTPWAAALRGLVLRPAAGFAVAILIVAGAGLGYLIRGADEAPSSTFVEAEPLGGHAGDASATLERTGDAATLHVHELPPLGRDEVYEVWVQRGDVMEPSTLFVVDRSASGEAAVPGPLAGAEAILVTVEPRRGSRQPTTPPLLRASL